AWSSPPPGVSAELVVKAVRAAGLPGRRHRGTGALQPGQVATARARDDPPGEPLQAGVLGRAVLPVVHERVRDEVTCEVAAELEPHPGFGELLLLAGQV